jgi:Methyltransferase domain
MRSNYLIDPAANLEEWGAYCGRVAAAALIQYGLVRSGSLLLRHDDVMAGSGDPAAHWDAAYAMGETTRSWFQQQPDKSLCMLDSAGVSAAASVIDVGGGASPLAGALLDRGFRDITVLDISANGTDHARRRLGPRADHVQWLVADVLTWQPHRRYGVWHDRAVFHFLTAAQDQRRYLHALEAATEPAAVAIFGCFAPDGPQQCSGLPVARYSATELADRLGIKWALVREDREEHVTPAGAVQPFTWATLRKSADN